MIFDTGIYSTGGPAGRRREAAGDARRGSAAAARRPRRRVERSSSSVFRSSFSFVSNEMGASFAPLGRSPLPRSRAALVRSPLSVVRHPALPRSFATLGRSPPPPPSVPRTPARHEIRASAAAAVSSAPTSISETERIPSRRPTPTKDRRPRARRPPLGITAGACGRHHRAHRTAAAIASPSVRAIASPFCPKSVTARRSPPVVAIAAPPTRSRSTGTPFLRANSTYRFPAARTPPAAHVIATRSPFDPVAAATREQPSGPSVIALASTAHTAPLDDADAFAEVADAFAVFLGRVADESSFRSLGGVFSRTLEPRGMERIVKRHLSVVRSRDDASLAKPRGGELEKTTRERLAPTSGDGRERDRARPTARAPSCSAPPRGSDARDLRTPRRPGRPRRPREGTRRRAADTPRRVRRRERREPVPSPGGVEPRHDPHDDVPAGGSRDESVARRPGAPVERASATPYSGGATPTCATAGATIGGFAIGGFEGSFAVAGSGSGSGTLHTSTRPSPRATASSPKEAPADARPSASGERHHRRSSAYPPSCANPSTADADEVSSSVGAASAGRVRSRLRLVAASVPDARGAFARGSRGRSAHTWTSAGPRPSPSLSKWCSTLLPALHSTAR